MFIKISNYKVIDTDFEEDIGNGGWYSIFLIYEQKHLNVAANMTLAFKYWANYSLIPIERVIIYNELHNPLYPKYKDDIQKYLLLI